VGQRSYYAVRVLRQDGLAACNLSGGYKAWEVWYPGGLPSGNAKKAPVGKNGVPPSPGQAARSAES
jgi:rhodanese-related sulfurtransferase